MNEKKYLFEDIKGKAFDLGIAKPIIPSYLRDNLKYNFWYWQERALENFLINEAIKKADHNIEPTHLMFNMATGTGKTMIMAALILYYHKKGYRHFIFFVNQNNIVDKTENNFITQTHTKYLFRNNIVIDDKTVNIRKVETFDDTDDIQIKFTSIQLLHNSVYLAAENSITLEDLQKKDLVMIGDEAHHLNALTIRNGQTEIDIPLELKENASEKDLEKSWEDTVLNKILKRGLSKQRKENKNVLLEFTATIPKDVDVIEKYRTKTIYKFELVDFLKAGYTKEINIVSTTLQKKQKILLAILFNWYRHQIALINNIPNFKPVILFRSKFADPKLESNSFKDYAEFRSIIDNLIVSDLDFLKNIENSINQDKTSAHKVYDQGKSRVKQILTFIKDEKIKTREIVNYIKDEFSEKNCIVTNSKENKATTKEKTTEEQEQLLNSLEDRNNHIRAIFTVKRLTEGWDVLNLFDIVRLYEGRDEYHDKKTGKRKSGDATTQEIQLIGRGVRYYPFTFNEHEKNKRKFDNDQQNPMRVLEEFYFHSGGRNPENEGKYIDELKRELKNKGFIQDNRERRIFDIKNEFKQTNFFKKIKIWKNERTDNPEKRNKTLSEIAPFECETQDIILKEQQVVMDNDRDETLIESSQKNKKTLSLRLKDFEKHIIAKAINIKATKDLSLLRFDNLRDELNIESIDDILKDNFIGNFKINITTSKNNPNEINHDEKLEILMNFFDYFVRKLKELSNPYKGTEFKPRKFEEIFSEPKEKLIDIEEYKNKSELIVKEFKKYKWFVMNDFTCTDEEEELLKFIRNRIKNLEEKYLEIYLLRNEEVYKIYDFDHGRGFEPDYLLFFKGKKDNLYYQLFIEPKGGQYSDKTGEFKDSQQGWKEEFLQKISDKYSDGNLLKDENDKYKLIGLPFFNKKEGNKFEEVFNNHLFT